MNARDGVPRSGFEREHNGLDAARAAFRWLVTGPDPLAVDGRLFAGLPPRAVPLDELRDLLLRPGCPYALRDAVWAHLVRLTRAPASPQDNTHDGARHGMRRGVVEGARGGGRDTARVAGREAWTVGAVGVALPALTAAATSLSARFADGPADVHAAVLAGFVVALAEIDLRTTSVMARLRWATYRAGLAAVREALDAPTPTGHATQPILAPPPSGHPDLVLARAVAAGVITAAEADLIAATRLEGHSLIDAGAARNMTYVGVRQARSRAETRLVAYLRGDARAASASGRDTAPGRADRPPTVTGLGRRPTRTSGDPVSRHPRHRAATGGAPRPAGTAPGTAPRPPQDEPQRPTPPPTQQTAQPSPLPTRRPSGSTQGEPRCA